MAAQQQAQAMTTSATPNPAHASIMSLCGLFAALAAGCTQTPQCNELGSCGGVVPVGEWALGAGHPSCSEDLYQAPPDTRLELGNLPPARVPLPEESLFDWCDLLVTNGGAEIAPQNKPRFSFESGPIGAAWIRYDALGADGRGTYAAGLTRTGTFVLDFPTLCMREFGAHGDVCAQLQTQIVSTSAHKNMLCVPNPSDPAGCLCQFDISVQSGGSGIYQPRDSKTLIHLLTQEFPGKTQAADFPQDATFCNKGSTLELTGANGQYLFDEPGLRTMALAKVTINCADGAKGPGEDGVDCGLACPTACGAAPAPMP
jgi:hypothetical protein